MRRRVGRRPRQGRDFAEILALSSAEHYGEALGLALRWGATEGVDVTTPVGLLIFLADHALLAPKTLRAYVAAVNRDCHERGRPLPGDDVCISWFLRRMTQLAGPCKCAPVIDDLVIPNQKHGRGPGGAARRSSGGL